MAATIWRAVVWLACPPSLYSHVFPCFGAAVLLPGSAAGVRNLTGSGINKRKANQPELQRGFGRHAGSGAACGHKEPSVSRLVLRIPVEYSLSHTLPHTHTHITIAHARNHHTDIKLTKPAVLNLFLNCFFQHLSRVPIVVTALAFSACFEREKNIRELEQTWMALQSNLFLGLRSLVLIVISKCAMYILSGNCLTCISYFHCSTCTCVCLCDNTVYSSQMESCCPK